MDLTEFLHRNHNLDAFAIGLAKNEAICTLADLAMSQVSESSLILLGLNRFQIKNFYLAVKEAYRQQRQIATDCNTAHKRTLHSTAEEAGTGADPDVGQDLRPVLPSSPLPSERGVFKVTPLDIDTLEKITSPLPNSAINNIQGETNAASQHVRNALDNCAQVLDDDTIPTTCNVMCGNHSVTRRGQRKLGDASKLINASLSRHAALLGQRQALTDRRKELEERAKQRQNIKAIRGSEAAGYRGKLSIGSGVLQNSAGSSSVKPWKVFLRRYCKASWMRTVWAAIKVSLPGRTRFGSRVRPFGQADRKHTQAALAWQEKLNYLQEQGGWNWHVAEEPEPAPQASWGKAERVARLTQINALWNQHMENANGFSDSEGTNEEEEEDDLTTDTEPHSNGEHSCSLALKEDAAKQSIRGSIASTSFDTRVVESAVAAVRAMPMSGTLRSQSGECW